MALSCLSAGQRERNSGLRMENKLVSVDPSLPFASTSLAEKKKKKERKRWNGDVGEGLEKQKIRDLGEVYSLTSFSMAMYLGLN